MAERLEGVGKPRRRTYYPWGLWTDGATWRAVEGEDFTVSASSFQTSLHLRARQQGLRVETGSPEKGVVEFRFFPPEETNAAAQSTATTRALRTAPRLRYAQVPNLPLPV
jgi:hypothetical protein